MVEIKQTLVGKLESKSSLSGKLNNAIEKVYPELEDLVVTPSSEEQKLKSSKYGFGEVIVKAVASDTFNIIPKVEGNTLIYAKAEVNGGVLNI